MNCIYPLIASEMEAQCAIWQERDLDRKGGDSKRFLAHQPSFTDRMEREPERLKAWTSTGYMPESILGQ
jgi:hypothetical protein